MPVPTTTRDPRRTSVIVISSPCARFSAQDASSGRVASSVRGVSWHPSFSSSTRASGGRLATRRARPGADPNHARELRLFPRPSARRDRAQRWDRPRIATDNPDPLPGRRENPEDFGSSLSLLERGQEKEWWGLPEADGGEQLVVSR